MSMGDFQLFIPLCNEDKDNTCTKELRNLETIINKRYGPICNLRAKPLSGKFKKWLEKEFKSHSQTVFHKCPDLWARVHILKDLYDDEEEKIITVTLSTSCSLPAEKDLNGFNKFFDDFEPHDLSSDEKIKAFVKCIGPTHIPEAHHHVPYEASKLLQNVDVGDTDDAELPSQNFETYSDTFGNHDSSVQQLSDVKVLNGFVDKLTDKEMFYKSFKLDQLDGSFETDEKRWKFYQDVSFALLPHLWEKKHCMALAYIAIHDNPPLQERALIMLKDVLLTQDKQMTFNSLVNTENILYQGMSNLRSIHSNKQDKDSDHLKLFQHFMIVYVMLLCEMIIGCEDVSQLTACDMHMKTIRNRNYRPNKEAAKMDKCLEPLEHLIQDITQQGCKTIKDKLDPILNPKKKGKKKKEKVEQEKKNPEEEKKRKTEADPLNSEAQTFCIKVIAIYSFLKQAFSKNGDGISKFEEYPNTNKNVDDVSADEDEKLCLNLVVQGLTHFLSVGLRNSSCSSENIDAALSWFVKGSSKKILSASDSKRILFDETVRLQQKLLYSRIPKIRGVAFNAKEKVTKSQKVLILRNEVEFFLFPLIQDIPKEWETEEEWVILKAKFKSEKVVLKAHDPTWQTFKKDALSRKSSLHNEAEVLKLLKHDNIIKLLAFQEGKCLPHFYIVEDYTELNLQTSLKHRRDTYHLFEYDQLLKFVINASSALQYCHAKGYVHRNLTAKSLFLVAYKSVKLCGFELCQQLPKSGNSYQDRSRAEIPVQWSAPESLNENIYTKSSDVWMLGHLMFEVLTHGMLPYSHLKDLSGEKLEEEIRKVNISLNVEKCLEEEYPIIKDCANEDSIRRPNVKQVLERLITAQHGKSRIPKDYPKFEGGKRSSVDVTWGQKCIQTHSLQESGECKTQKISDMIFKTTTEKEHIFRERLESDFPPQEILINVKEKKLDSVLGPFEICLPPHGKPEIIIRIPKEKTYTLESFAFCCDPEKHKKNILVYLYEISRILAALHDKNWMIGDISSSKIYVDISQSQRKVHIVSRAYLSLAVNTKIENLKTSPITEEQMKKRAAPEVIGDISFSKESDVYCFGMLLWEVLTAVDHQKNDYGCKKPFADVDADEVPVLVGTKQWHIYHNKPNCCSDELYELIKKCVAEMKTERPTMLDIKQEFEKLDLRCEEEDPIPTVDDNEEFIFDDEDNDSLVSNQEKEDHSGNNCMAEMKYGLDTMDSSEQKDVTNQSDSQSTQKSKSKGRTNKVADSKLKSEEAYTDEETKPLQNSKTTSESVFDKMKKTLFMSMRK